MADYIDSMIEGWAKSRASSVRQSVENPLEGLEGFRLTESPKPKAAFVSPSRLDPAGDICARDTLALAPLDAARAVLEAVLAKGGKRPSVDSWKPVAAKAMGLSRLGTKRWKEVLDAGVGAGLFTVDTESLSYPILVPCEITEPVISEPVISEPERQEDAPTPSEGVTLPCGHTNWSHQGVTEDDPHQVAARAEGFCCAALAAATASHHRLNPGTNRKAVLPVDWRVKGLHEPIPEALRRSPDKEGGYGFPGLCADPETGLYIGGVGNNCRLHGGPERCVVHGR